MRGSYIYIFEIICFEKLKNSIFYLYVHKSKTCSLRFCNNTMLNILLNGLKIKIMLKSTQENEHCVQRVCLETSGPYLATISSEMLILIQSNIL